MRLLLARSGVALLVVSLVNCSAWHATQAPLSELEGKKVRITTSGGDRQEGALVDADSLGFAVLQCERAFKNRYDRFAKPDLLTFDTTTITMVEKRVHSSSRTLVMVISVLLVVGLAADLAVISISNMPE